MPGPDTAPKMVRLNRNTYWLIMETPLISSVPICPTMRLSIRLTKFVTTFCRIMGTAMASTYM